MIKKSGAVRKWLTALILSPGMIFTQAYLLVWLGTNVYLDQVFKRHLKQLVLSETGGRYQLDVRSLQTGPCLDSIILKKLELSPLEGSANQNPGVTNREIKELRIDCPDLGFLFFRLTDETPSVQKVSRRIISRTAQ